MILHTLFLKLKSPEVADSWFMHTSCMQQFIKVCLKIYNRTAPVLPLCRQVKTGSLGSQNTIHPRAIIDYPHVNIGNNCTIGDNVVIEKNSIIGNNVNIGPGAVIGSEGFEQRRVAGGILPVAHIGGVIIHDNVIIGSRVCVDRSALGEYTEIGESTTVKENVQIGHGIKVGRFAAIGEGSMIGGYAVLGNHIVIGRHCSIADGICLHDGVIIPDGSIITRDMKGPGETRDSNTGPCPEPVE